MADSSIERRTGGRFTSTADLVEAVEAGDAQAASVWARAVRSLAAGIASLVNVLDPEVVVLGGGIALAGDTLFVPLRREWRTPSGVRWAKRCRSSPPARRLRRRHRRGAACDVDGGPILAPTASERSDW